MLKFELQEKEMKAALEEANELKEALQAVVARVTTVPPPPFPYPPPRSRFESHASVSGEEKKGPPRPPRLWPPKLSPSES